MIERLRAFRVIRALSWDDDKQSIHGVGFLPKSRLIVTTHGWCREREEVIGDGLLFNNQGKLLALYQSDDSTGRIAVHPDGTQYACTQFRSTFVHSLRSRRLRRIRKLKYRNNNSNALVYSHDGRWLITGTQGSYVRSINPGEQTSRLEKYKLHPLLRWNTETWEPIVMAEAWQNVMSLTLSQDGTLLGVGGLNGGVQLWDTTDWSLISSRMYLTEGESASVEVGTFLHKQKALLVSHSEGSTVQLLSSNDLSDQGAMHDVPVGVYQMMPSGRVFVSACWQHGVLFHDATTGKRLAQYIEREGEDDDAPGPVVGHFAQAHDEGHLGLPEALTITPLGRTLAVGDSWGMVHFIRVPKHLR